MKAELHSHSHYSRGTNLPTEGIPSPRDIIRTAKRKGLDAIAITDHNVFKAFSEGREESRKQGILLIPGEEVTSREGHIIGLGINELIPAGLPLEETIERIHEQGGVVVAPHPFDIKNDGVGEGFRKADAVEVFNAINLDRFSNLVTARKARGLSQVVGSDAHTLDMIGNAVNMLDAHDVDSLVKNVKQGRVKHVRMKYNKVSDIREWVHQRFWGSREHTLRYVNQNYSPAKRRVSLYFLNKFLSNRGGFFTALSHFGIGCSVGYGAVKALRNI